MDLIQYGITSSEVEFLAKKERDSNLVWSISSEFTGDADQITITPASGKTFYLVGIKLYPVTNVAIGNITNNTESSRRTDIELTFNGTIKDVVTYNENANVSNLGGQSMGQLTGQLTGMAKGISMSGDGIKTVKLTSTNTSGTYRVSVLGYYEVS